MYARTRARVLSGTYTTDVFVVSIIGAVSAIASVAMQTTNQASLHHSALMPAVLMVFE